MYICVVSCYSVMCCINNYTNKKKQHNMRLHHSIVVVSAAVSNGQCIIALVAIQSASRGSWHVTLVSDVTATKNR